VDGKICLSIQKISEEYSNKIYNPTDNEDQSGFPSINEIYKRSIIDWNDYYENCIIMTVRTCNSMEAIERMEFHKFNSLLSHLNIYIDKENKAQNGDGTSNPAEDAKTEMAKNMASSKSMMSSMKMPKLK